MSSRLYIVTCVHEPYFRYMDALWRSIRDAEPHGWELRWLVMIQNAEIDPCGVQKQNEALDTLTDMDAFVLTFAADSIVHPAFLRRTWEAHQEHPRARAMVVRQLRSPYGGYLAAAPENMQPCHVSGDNVLIRRDLYGDRRWSWEQHGGTCDGVMVQELYRAHPKDFLFLDETLSYFNFQRW